MAIQVIVRSCEKCSCAFQKFHFSASSAAPRSGCLVRELREDGLSDRVLEKIICPVGLPIGSNDPAEITISIAAQLLERHP